MSYSKVTIIVILMTACIGFTFADVIPGRWEKVANLAPGTPIFVEMQSGDRIQGKFASLADESLAVDVGPGNRMTVPKNAVSRVLQEKKGKRQTALGALIGVGGGVATGLAISANFDETFFARGDLMALTCGGIGALTGALIGRSIGGDERQEVIYRSR